MIHVPGRLVHGENSDKILKAYYQVYDALPYGLPESAYQRAMQIALTDLGLKLETEKIFAVYFRGQCVGRYRGDLVVEGKVIV